MSLKLHGNSSAFTEICALLTILDPLNSYMDNPLISVLIPMFNAELFIVQCVQSIICQTYAHWELIIIDDGCTDNSLSILHKFIESKLYLPQKIRIFSLDRNYGIVHALNTGLLHCNGEYIARMDADDICFPQRLELQLKYLLDNPNIDVVGTGIQLFNNQNVVQINECSSALSSKSTINILRNMNYGCTDTLSIKWSVLFFCPMFHPTIMYHKKKEHKNMKLLKSDFNHNFVNNNSRKTMELEIFSYSSKYSHCEDYHLWWRLLFDHGFQFANINDCCLQFRKHSKSMSNMNRNEQKLNSLKIVHDFVNNEEFLVRMDLEKIDEKVIAFLKNPSEIKTRKEFHACFHLLEKWEHFVCDGKKHQWVKEECDKRMSELISLCFQKSMMIDAIQLMNIFKKRNPRKELL